MSNTNYDDEINPNKGWYIAVFIAAILLLFIIHNLRKNFSSDSNITKHENPLFSVTSPIENYSDIAIPTIKK